MKRFFLSFVLLLLAGCGAREPATITPPKEAAAVIEPFLKEMAAGQKEKAAAYLSPAAMDELEKQFAQDHKALAAVPKLTPRFVSQNGGNIKVGGRDLTADGHEVNLVYAAKKGEKWTTATVRAYRYRDEPYKVEYWRVTDKPPAPPMSSNINPEKLKKSEAYVRALYLGLAVCGILALALILWLVKRKPHLIAPDAPAEVRRSAATVRDDV